jgi:hypothetical protein
MAQPLQRPLSSSQSFGPDYAVLWRKLEQQLLALRQGSSDSLCIADELNKVKVLQGAWGAYGYVYNMMQEMLADARGDKPDEK